MNECYVRQHAFSYEVHQQYSVISKDSLLTYFHIYMFYFLPLSIIVWTDTAQTKYNIFK